MVSLTCTTAETDGVTLVTGRIENADRPRRVRLENELDGPVWPPRRRGVPAAGWTESGFECVLGADESRALGYACPAPAEEPPLVVAEAEPVDLDEFEPAFDPQGAVPSVEETPTGVVRALGSPRPPRDAVPTPDVNAGTNTGSDDGTATDSPGASAPTPPPDDGSASAGSPSEASTTAATTAAPDADGRPGEPRVEAVDAWFGGVEARLDLAAELSGTTRLPVVADALERAGGLAGLRDVDEQLDEDAETLRQVAERARTLADRAESATIPVDELDRLR